MGYQDVPAGGGSSGKLSLASVGFAGPGAGASGGGYKELLVMALPKDDGLDGAKVAEVIGVRLPDVAGAVRTILGRREVREFASGALAGAMSKAILAPLETIRTRMVVGVGSRHIFGSFVEIIEQNGWQGLWAGNTINMIRIIPTQAVELGTFECVKRSMAEAQEKWKEDGYPKIQLGNLKIELPLHFLSPVAIAGAAAGIAGTLACHPLEVIKDRLTISREVYPTISLAFSKIYQTDGIRGLYAGLCPTLIGMLPYSTCYYFMYDTIKTSYCRLHKKPSLSRPELLVIGALSGLTASTISFPLEVARKRLMVGALQGKCPPNMIAALSEVIREEGLLGLYRGWGASCLKVMPNSGITWMFYEAWKDILLADKDKQRA
ncbi:putative mitochondrial adenine nucleotide transporter BTL1 [Dichanthelium oligosanthes]|uniref:Putative mitochondrial adenine nucleotide transporter BTL1 n=1 Tax=Dichanthelium oligosanthes TaxID=888268 RepID=A0A1E5VGD8_9POAL|nr:putative mitochondrial adenine nucleotide transporter BTL1 [Dichanthelium oligosanthes]